MKNVFAAFLSVFIGSQVIMPGTSHAKLTQVQTSKSTLAVVQEMNIKKLGAMSQLKLNSKLEEALSEIHASAILRLKSAENSEETIAAIAERTGVQLTSIAADIATVHTNVIGIMKLTADPDIAFIELSQILRPNPAVTGSNQ